MFIIELTYKQSLDEVNKHLEAHRAFLDTYYKQNVFIASGRKNPRDGGVILAVGDKEKLHRIIKDDPFFKHDMANYRMIEFEPNKYDKHFEKLAQQII